MIEIEDTAATQSKPAGKRAYLVDLSSMNGCYLNGHKIGQGDRKRLKHNDVLRFGNASCNFRFINT